MKTTVSEKGQITILEVTASGGRLLAVKKGRSDPFSKWRGKGALPGGLTVDEYLGRGRG